MREGALKAHLRAVLGEEGFIAFCQELGGTRVYVPYQLREDNEIVRAVGRDAASRLSRAMAPATIRVPLARRDRALHFRQAGLSNPQIARKLGITETGVEKLFAREEDLPDARGRSRQPQLPLFDA